MIMKMVTELGSEIKLTPPDEVQSFHVLHLPHLHSVARNNEAVLDAAVGGGGGGGGLSVVHEMTVPHQVELI